MSQDLSKITIFSEKLQAEILTLNRDLELSEESKVT